MVGQRAIGFTLVELLVAMVLGLLVSGSAVGIFISNRQANRATDNLSRVQENARIAFELMAQDIRQAGGNPCNRNFPPLSVINGAAGTWWQNFANPLFGYEAGVAFPGGAGIRVATTDAIEIKSAASSGATVVSHNPVSATFQLNTVNHGLDQGDIALVCDNGRSTIFQVSNANPGTNAGVNHNTGAVVSPGNCSQLLGAPCGTPGSGAAYTFAGNGVIAQLRAERWFIGTNPRGGRSLYAGVLRNTGGGTAGIVDEEIVEGVTDMQLTYLVNGAPNYVAANAVAAADWNAVVAVRIVLTVQSLETVGTDGNALNRNLTHVVALRNRMP